MSNNMAYCRFENTLDDLSKAEADARARLIELCKEIAEESRQ